MVCFNYQVSHQSKDTEKKVQPDFNITPSHPAILLNTCSNFKMPNGIPCGNHLAVIVTCTPCDNVHMYVVDLPHPMLFAPKPHTQIESMAQVFLDPTHELAQNIIHNLCFLSTQIWSLFAPHIIYVCMPNSTWYQECILWIKCFCDVTNLLRVDMCVSERPLSAN
jgi:hypothetical protein